MKVFGSKNLIQMCGKIFDSEIFVKKRLQKLDGGGTSFSEANDTVTESESSEGTPKANCLFDIGCIVDF